MSYKIELNKLLGWYHPEVDAICYQSVLWQEGFVIPKEYAKESILKFFDSQGVSVYFYHPQNLLYKIFTQPPEFNEKMTSLLVLEGDVFELVGYYKDNTKIAKEIGVNLLIASKDIRPQSIDSFFEKPADYYYLYLKQQTSRKTLVDYLENLDLQRLIDTLVKTVSKDNPILEKTDRKDLFLEPFSNNWNVWNIKSFLLIKEFMINYPKEVSNKMLYKKTFSKLSYENHIYKNLKSLSYLQRKFKKT